MIIQRILMFMLIFAMVTGTANSALIHHWEFENDATDSAGSANGTVIGGTAAYAAGKVGNAISLDGLDDYVSISNSTAITPATDYTLAAWVYWEGAKGYRGRIASGQLSGGEGEVFTMSRAADGSDRKLFLNLLPNNSTSITESADNTISTGIWMHVAYTLSSTEGVKLYLDGNVIATNTALTTHDPAANFVIGARPDTLATNPDFFDGLIDDVRIYDNVLSAGEIAGIMGDQTNPTVDAGSNWITWSDEPVTLDDVVVTNNDPDAGELTLDWTAENIAGISVGFSATDVSDPIVTIIKDISAANPTTVTLNLTVTQAGKEPVMSSMEIDVYDTACDAGQSVGTLTLDSSDFNGDCITDFEDLMILAAAWLADYQAEGPAEK